VELLESELFGLARAGGNRSRAASALGLSRQGPLKTLARLGLDAAPMSRA
jgi:hypothetical protein